MKSNRLLSNIEKVILGALIFIAALVFTLYQGSINLQSENIRRRIDKLDFSLPPREIEGAKEYREFVTGLRQAKSFDKYEAHLTRNGFLKFIESLPEIPPFELRAVHNTYLDLEYKGFIEAPTQIVAQIEINKRSYFIKEGEELRGYKFGRVRGEYIVVEDQQGNEYTLPLRQKVLSDDYEAALYVSKTNKTVRVKLGDIINDYKVLDISPESVVLLHQSSNQRLTVEK